VCRAVMAFGLTEGQVGIEEAQALIETKEHDVTSFLSPLIPGEVVVRSRKHPTNPTTGSQAGQSPIGASPSTHEEDLKLQSKDSNHRFAHVYKGTWKGQSVSAKVGW
jgi:hypothetical protein